MDRCSTSHLLATLIIRADLTGSGNAMRLRRIREVGTNPREYEASRGRGVAEIGNRLLKHRTVPNLNQLLVTLLADSEGGRVGFCKLCSLSPVKADIVESFSNMCEARLPRGRAEN
jgi:hypothetical protein